MNRIFVRTFVSLLLVLAFLASGASAAPSGYKGYPRGNALITAQELKGLIDAREPKLVILAAQSNLEYLPGHIPGARQVDRPAYAAPPETQGGIEGNIIDAGDFTRLARSLGIDRGSTVVIYEDKYDATRLWWAFTYYGKSDVRILDGGIQAWKAADFPVEILPPAARTKPGNFVATVTHPVQKVPLVGVDTKVTSPPRLISWMLTPRCRKNSSEARTLDRWALRPRVSTGGCSSKSSTL